MTAATVALAPVAVVGVGAIMPDAPDAAAFWTNIKNGRYSISDVPPERWDPELYYDPDPHAPDKTYSRIGGWVRDFGWDPLAWRLPVPPTVSAQMEEGQKWSVTAARAALLDAGWPDWTVDPERVAVIIGNAIGGDKQYRTVLRVEFAEVAHRLRAAPSFAALPDTVRAAVLAEARESFLAGLPEITEDTMPGELANVIAGRVANLFNFRGPNFTTDAACASGLAAMSAAVRGLQAGDFDAAVTGGVDRNMNAAAFVKFCKIGALSATGTRPFDAGADGFVMGEGAALFVLKRLADAERDGDHIYAVLLGLGGSSDGRGKGITAPNPVGQRLAVERAWQTAGLDPALATCVEAHGTSTRVGDATELGSLSEVFAKAGAATGSIALGSVKSNIGHLKAAAGAAGLFKTVLALHDKVLAPSLHFDEPNPNVDWDTIPFRVNTELREWPAPAHGVRCAGVSAFGFGGTNFHAVVEEYVPGRHRDPERTARSYAGVDLARPTAAPAAAGPARPPLRGAAVVGGRDDADVAGQLTRLAADAAAGRAPAPAAPDPALAGAAVRVAIDYADAADLAAKAGKAVEALRAGDPARWRMLRAQGVHVGRGAPGRVAFLYTGQGSQYVNMLHDLRAREPLVAGAFAEADRVMTPLLGRPLTAYIFDEGTDEATRRRLEQQLMQTEITQPAVLATDLALTRLLESYGLRPDMVMGHSLGEYGALVAAGALSFDAALEAVSARGREMASLTMADNGAMAAVFGPLAEIERIVAATEGYVVVANINSGKQAVVGGATEAVRRAITAFEQAGLTATPIPVSHAFHTSIVAPASEPLKVALRRLDVRPPVLPIVSNVTGEFYPADAGVETMLDLLGRQVAAPVQFVKGLRTLYAAGARIFVEVGPKKALHGFVEDVLGDDVLALFTNHPKAGDVASFNQALCGLYAAGLGFPGPAVAAPVAAARPAAPQTADTVATTAGRTPMTTDRYAELGHLFADVLERGMHVYAGTAPGGPPTAAPEPVVITGAALGLPGVDQVFDDDNVGRILAGQQFIDTVPHRLRRAMVDRRITRLVKREAGDATFETITNEADVIKLAGRAAPLDVVNQFGVDADRDAALDVATRLAIGAGLDALRDAGIPLVMQYKTTTLGTRLPDRWGLPTAMRDDTGVIFASAFPGYDNFARDIERYLTDRGRREQLLALEAVRARLGADGPATAEVDRRIGELRHALAADPYVFDRRFLFRCLSMGHSQFAELIGARGPNTQINAACASTTQATTLAEDWIRAGRCRRVVVVSADDATSDVLLPWLASGFLASGAAATDDIVEEAATPFDRRRHGMIVGMGAAAFVVEAADAARERGLQPICEVLGAVTANSAFHGTRLDVEHIGQVMEQLFTQAEARGVRRHAIAPATVFVSHETYTPARGGSASAEINALRRVFGADADAVVITNTKGFTGHAMGAGIEDVVAIKALETGLVPPVPNFKEPDPELGQLNLSAGGAYPVRYALRLAAGFGSQIAMSLLRWTPLADNRHRAPDELGYAYRIVDQAAWHRWLTEAGGPDARLEVVQRRLRLADNGALPEAPPAPAAPPVVIETPVSPAPVAPIAATPAPPAGDEITDAVVGIVSGLTGYPPDLLDVDLDLEADLGVDTVKQAEVFAAVRERFGVARDDNLRLRDFPTLTHVIGWIREQTGTPVAEAVAPVAEAVVTETVAPPADDEITEAVVGIVSGLTGYPPDLLDVDLDLEADLGVDTVKQAEVFAAVRERFGVARDDNLRLRDFPTLTHVIGWIREQTGTPAAEPVATEAVTPPAGDEIADAVVGIVSGLTGYPPDLLDVDLDLEADLGVDTVKQAEVFAAVRERFGVARDDNLRLRDFPTLTHVIAWVRDRAGQPAPAAGPAEQTTEAPRVITTVAGDLEATDRITRRVPVPVLRPEPAACVPTGITLDGGTRVVVAPDQGGVGEALVTRLTRLGVQVLTVDPDDPGPGLDAALADGPVHGVYWLPALDDEGQLDGLDLDGWRAALRRRVRALYTTMRRLYDGSPFLVTASRLGGYHGYDEGGATCPLGGAVTGFAKAYRRERPEALVKAVDFAVGRKTAAPADRLVDETLRDPGCVEVGYADGRRWGVGLAERPFPAANAELGPDQVFLVTGAAGSIVSAITADLAAASRGTFHLLDLTPEPDPADPDLRRYAEDREGFKAELATRLRDRGERPTPVLIDRELARFERLQAALAAVQAVEQAGGSAHYHSVDLTDADAVARAMAEVRATSGRIDVLLHAAGVEISHALPDKEPAEFDLVLGVKGDGLFTVLHAARDLPLGTVIAFSSVAGRFGNVGQTDYSAANDLQCKVLSSLRRSRPGVRTLAIDWTAWGDIGMATRGSIPKLMERAGVEMLPAAAGVAWIRRELTCGTADGEVVVAGALGAMAAEYHETGGLDPASLPGGGPVATEPAGLSVHDGLVVHTTLDPATTPFLNDHRIDGTPVLPGVMGIEAFAEAARLLVPDWSVVAVENVDFSAPVKFYRDEPRTLRVTALLRPDGAELLAECRLSTERTLPGSDQPQRTTHFTGSVRLAAQQPHLPSQDDGEVHPQPPELTPEEVYRLYFHGPAYQVVGSAWRQGDGVAARLADGLPDQADAPTVTGPRLVELCFQTAGLWEAGRQGRLALPAHVDAVRLGADLAERAGLSATVRPDGSGGFDCVVGDGAGAVVLRVDGYRTVRLPDPLPDEICAPFRTAMAG
ncbi:SDR family NAD(P)-dependent oxidoreductase [Actinoplanes sp. NPDC049599]|uniref:SDR family NAD(P)-dependent oxidoreductase n=1 Tax=Actinoplanes sp. NPDC049599 TaxID=3363903 RepID=UPI0037BDF545